MAKPMLEHPTRENSNGDVELRWTLMLQLEDTLDVMSKSKWPVGRMWTASGDLACYTMGGKWGSVKYL